MRRPVRLTALALFVVIGCAVCSAQTEAPEATPGSEPAAALEEDTAVAIFAGGCFWCMERPFDELDGVVSTTSGYTGGQLAAPTYRQVSSGATGHVEAVRIVYRPAQISYEELLDVFWRNVDPLDGGGQFCDRGPQYATAIFVQNDEERAAARGSKRALDASDRFETPIVTPIRDAAPFYDAEDYHQDYYRKNPVRYRFYRSGCGRDARLTELWGEGAGH